MSTPYFIDIEASGFGRGSYPIEVGVIDPHSDCFCAMIRPADNWTHWDDKAESLHQINRETLLQHGHDITDVAYELNQRYAGKTLYSDAWGNDNSWLARLFDEAGLYPRFRLETVRALLDEAEAELWQDYKQRIIESYSFRRHRAAHDATILQLSYLAVKSAAKPDSQLLNQILRASGCLN